MRRVYAGHRTHYPNSQLATHFGANDPPTYNLTTRNSQLNLRITLHFGANALPIRPSINPKPVPVPNGFFNDRRP